MHVRLPIIRLWVFQIGQRGLKGKSSNRCVTLRVRFSHGADSGYDVSIKRVREGKPLDTVAESS